MYSYNRKSIVSNSEIQALKEVIFERARQRAEAMANSAQNQYTSSFKAEIMEIARNSFNSPSNPFAQNLAQPIKNDPATEAKPKIGFPERKIPENIKNKIIESKNAEIKESISRDEVLSIMNKTGTDFGNRKNFVGALKFLNAQAGIYMAGQNKAKFDRLA